MSSALDLVKILTDDVIVSACRDPHSNSRAWIASCSELTADDPAVLAACIAEAVERGLLDTAQAAALVAGSGPALPRFFAHRFGRSLGPDSAPSTLAAALERPLDGLETDCVLTSDGRLALLHDPLLSHGTTLDGWAQERTAAEIVRSHLVDSTGTIVDERPLLLEDLWPLVEGHELTVQLEVKAICDEALALETSLAVCDALEACAPPAGISIEVISFWPGALPPAARAGWDTRLIIAAPYTPGALADWAVAEGVTGVILEAAFWGDTHVARWRDAGLSLMSGVCNDLDLAAAMLTYGPDIISTDRPHDLRDELAAAPAIRRRMPA